jgi:hypothetical protein
VSHEDDYLDYAEQEALEDLFRQHTQEFKNDLAHAALLKTGPRVEVVRAVLAEARKVLSVSPSAALVFAASASEITLKDLLFVPVLSGLIHEDFGVSIIVKLLTRITRDKMAGPLISLLKLSTFIHLDEAKRTPESLPILTEVGNIAKQRNGILHNGERADETKAQDAIAVADYLLNDTFQSLLALHKLYMSPEERDWVGRQWKTIVPLMPPIVPLMPPAEEDQDPWQ